MSTRPDRIQIKQDLSQSLRAFIFGGGLLCIWGLAIALSTERDRSTAKSTVGDFRMYITEILRQDILDRLTANDNENKIIRLGNWISSPFETRGATDGGNIRIRFERDYVIIWHHSTSSRTKGDMLQLLREATEVVLASPYAVGEPNMVVKIGSGQKITAKEIAMFDWPREIPGTGAVSCGYYNAGLRKWRFVAILRVLVKGQDTIIALEKSKARTAASKHVYEGLNAGKIGLTKKEAEKLRSRPVLAKNTIFAKDVDVSKVPDALLNACMWPVEDAAVVGAKDMGPASQLRPPSENRENSQR